MADREIGRGEAIRGTRGVDYELPRRQQRQSEQPAAPSDVARAFAEVRAATANLQPDVHMRYDEDLGLVVVTVTDEGGAERVLRQISVEELLRLARLLRAGRQQLLDRLL